MNNENETTGLMYTVNPENSFFNSTLLSLNVFLEEETGSNPYIYRVFDLSQKINDVQYNAIFLSIKNQYTASEDPNALTFEYEHECGISTLAAVSSLGGYSAFDCETRDTALVISMYTFTENTAELQGYAEALYPMVKSLYDKVIRQGSFQDQLQVVAEGGKKRAGISRINKS